MKPAAFDYHAPETDTEAVALLAELGIPVPVLVGHEPELAVGLAVADQLVVAARHVRARRVGAEQGGQRVGRVRRPARLDLDEHFGTPLLRRVAVGDDPHPVKLGRRSKGDEALTKPDESEDFFVVQAMRAGILLDQPSFEAVIVDRNGRMAMMRTIAPSTFVSFKRWLSQQKTREAFKRQRDAAQASAVEELLKDERLMQV